MNKKNRFFFCFLMFMWRFSIREILCDMSDHLVTRSFVVKDDKKQNNKTYRIGLPFTSTYVVKNHLLSLTIVIRVFLMKSVWLFIVFWQIVYFNYLNESNNWKLFIMKTLSVLHQEWGDRRFQELDRRLNRDKSWG